METKLEVSQKFEMQDTPDFSKRFWTDMVMIFLSVMPGIILLVISICNAPEISHFISRLVKTAFYGPDRERFTFLWIVACWLIHLHSTKLHRTRWGVRSFIGTHLFR